MTFHALDGGWFQVPGGEVEAADPTAAATEGGTLTVAATGVTGGRTLSRVSKGAYLLLGIQESQRSSP